MRAVVTVSFVPGQQMEIDVPDDWDELSDDDKADHVGDEAEDLVWMSTKLHVTVLKDAADEETPS